MSPRRVATSLLTLLAAVAVPAPGAAQEAAPAGELACPAPEARQFDFWIGEWDVVNRNRRPDGRRWFETGRATNRVYPVADGCAVVEHWRGNAAGRFVVGFSVRAWNPAEEAWDLALLWPTSGRPSWGELQGTFRHGRGQFFTENVTAEGDTTLTRFTFSDITPTRLRWQNGVSRDGGVSWTSSWIMEFTRRDPVLQTGLWNGVTPGHLRCGAAPHRAFDDLLGEWVGERIEEAGDTVAVRFRMAPILEGCAVMQRTEAVDGSFESFRVRAFEPGPERWVEYGIDTDRPVLTRSVSAPVPGAWSFEEAREAGLDRRVEWTVVEGRVVIQTLEDRGGAWHELSRIVLEQRLGGPAR